MLQIRQKEAVNAKKIIDIHGPLGDILGGDDIIFHSAKHSYELEPATETTSAPRNILNCHKKNLLLSLPEVTRWIVRVTLWLASLTQY
jgi:hypothetical protein